MGRRGRGVRGISGDYRMPEPKVISIQSGVRTEQLEKFVKMTNLKKWPRAAQVVHLELMKRKAA